MIAIHPNPTPCKKCGTILQASLADEYNNRCPGCGEPVCYICGCTELTPCVYGAATCSWVPDARACSRCFARLAYELYQQATGRPADDPYYLQAPTAFAVKGLAHGV